MHNDLDPVERLVPPIRLSDIRNDDRIGAWRYVGRPPYDRAYRPPLVYQALDDSPSDETSRTGDQHTPNHSHSRRPGRRDDVRPQVGRLLFGDWRRRDLPKRATVIRAAAARVAAGRSTTG